LSGWSNAFQTISTGRAVCSSEVNRCGMRPFESVEHRTSLIPPVRQWPRRHLESPMVRTLRRAALLTTLLVPGPLALGAQVARLGAPQGRLAEEFSDIRGVRELADGRLLVSDYIDQRVVMVDAAMSSVSECVTEGIGPAEVRLAGRLVAMPGDSTLLVDIGNTRLMVLDPEGRPRRVLPADRPGVTGVRGVDANGRLYFTVPGWSEGPRALAADSVRLVRWDPATDRTEDVAVVQGERMRSDIREPAMVPRIPIVGYGTSDGWVVAANGVVRVVRGADYSIETISIGNPPVRGPSNTYTARAVTAADREAFVRDFNRSSPTSGRGPGGGMGFSPQMNDAEIAATVARTEFAERHPMFRPGAVVAAPAGRVWVGRPPQPGQPVRYDVFDAAGRLVQAVELPSGQRVALVTARGVYVIAEDADGIQRLERHRLP
jgi:hypothetical protein